MMISKITQYDEKLLAHSLRLLAATEANPESRALLEKYGFSKEEQARGHRLVADAKRAFEWERSGKAWNFLSLTPERRAAEAKDWYADRRRRYLRSLVLAAETNAGLIGEGPASQRPLTAKVAWGALELARAIPKALSPFALMQHRKELAQDLVRAKESRPADAPPPKDTVLVELSGWFERWRLLVQRVFRERPDLMEPFGLTPGKAPPRLRNKNLAAKYGESAAPKKSLPVI